MLAELWCDAVLSFPARRRRRAGAELRHRAGDAALWRRTARPCAWHLHHDVFGWIDAGSTAGRRADGGLGLAGGILFPRSDRSRSAAAVARHADLATAPGNRSL